MSPKAVEMRASAEEHPIENPMIDSGSDNECYIDSLNQTQTRSWRGLENCSRRERLAIEASFWPHVKKTHGCWLWTRSVQAQRGGHGQLRVKLDDGRVFLLKTHRLAWELAYGSIPGGLQINHHCDVPHCVRADHLYVGSQQDNLQDARDRGRLDESKPRTKKLTLTDRLAIQAAPWYSGICDALAARYGVSRTCISLTRQGRFAGALQPVQPTAERRADLNQIQHQREQGI